MSVKYLVAHFEDDVIDGVHGIGIHCYVGTPIKKPVGGPPSLVFTNKGYQSRKDLSGALAILPLEPSHYLDISMYREKLVDKNYFTIASLISFIKDLDGKDNLVIITECQIIQKAIKAANKDPEAGPKLLRSKVPLKHIAGLLHKDLSNYKSPVVIMEPDVHKGRLGCTRAKFLASKAANYKESKIEKINYEKTNQYWKGWIDRPELLAFRFLAVSTAVDKSEYLVCTEPFKGDYYNVGKVAGKCGYSVVHLKEPEDILNRFDSFIRRVTDDNTILSLDLGHVYNKQINRALMKDFEGVFRGTEPYSTVYKYIVDDVALVTMTKPVNMVIHGLERCADLKDILMLYEGAKGPTYQLPPTIKIEHTDITDYFYEEKQLKSKTVMVAKEIVKKGGKSISVCKPGRKGKLRLKYNSDIPTNHRISRLSHIDTKVTLASWTTEDGAPIRYAVIWDTPQGTAIYSNLDTNRIY